MKTNGQTPQDPVPFNVDLLKMIYRIAIFNPDSSSGEVRQGTCFMGKYKDNVYIVTARHLFTEYGYKSGNNVKVIIQQATTTNITTQLPVYFFPLDGQSDIAVMKVPNRIPEENDYDLDTPFNLRAANQDIMYIGYPLSKNSLKPDVRHGNLLEINTTNPPNPICIFRTKSEEGFSGAPVFAYDQKEKKYYIISIISAGYLDDLGKTCGTIIEGARAAIENLLPR